MMKGSKSLKNLIPEAAEALRKLLEQVPAIRVEDIEREPYSQGRTADLLVHLDVDGHKRMLVCEVKPNGQPRNVRLGLHQLREWVSQTDRDIRPVFVAPYLSPEAQALCREEETAYLDLHGNARLVFDGIFIERIVAGRPVAERRELKSLFKPKSGQVLRVLLRDPQHQWRVTDLAEEAAVSIGHVSNVRTVLLAREWAEVGHDGLFLSDPDALLDAWRDEYEPPSGTRHDFYTSLHGTAFESALAVVLRADDDRGKAILSSFSAAQWLAPYGRTGSQYFYADRGGLQRLKAALKLMPAPSGANIIINVPKDEGVFLDVTYPAESIVCTSPTQTYLDLTAAGERGQEAAEHLRREKLTWQK